MKIVVSFEGTIPDYVSNFSNVRYTDDPVNNVHYITIENYGQSVSFDFDSVTGFYIK